MNLSDLSTEVIAAFGGAQIVVTGVAVFLGRIWIARDQAKYKAHLDARLDGLRNEREQGLEALRAAIQTISTSHTAATKLRLNAVADLWKAVLRTRELIPDVITYSDILSDDEYGLFLKRERFVESLSRISQQSITDLTVAMSENVEESRPFVGEVCWSIFFSYRQILGRILFNFNIMRETQKVRLWFEDKLIKNVLSNLLAEQDYSHFENLEVGRFLYVQNKIERRLLATMNEILSGRSSSSEMLEHAQLLVDLANQSEIAKRREVGA